ncbi:MAG: MBOAT family protein [Abitibacteriaceae bacterium]|nr:MBOAT family protein [Abditibacteriaceae bacterium]
MLFSEPVFVFLFLPVVLFLYVVLPQRLRNLLLTGASLFFYACGETKFVFILIASIILNYYFAIWISQTSGPRQSLILALGIMSDLSLLLYFKYANFFITSLNQCLMLAHVHHPLSYRLIVLPLGISFFTFHKISYKVDVFRGHALAKRNPLELALYILFFPQLIAGPIVRYNEIADAIGVEARVLNYQRLCRGIEIFIIGLGKKMLLANTVALPADQIFTVPTHQLTPALAWLGVACYTLQIYFDFAGYSDMAIGLACIFGFDFPTNFNYPYSADSVTDFWRRWHMSLSRWFRDYLYIPLGGNRVSLRRLYLNLLLVFLLCGLWHGAAWTFIVWGVYHGLFLVLERLFLGKLLIRLPRLVRHVYLLLVVMVGWVFFRAASLPYALHYLLAMFGLSRPEHYWYYPSLYLDKQIMLAIIVGAIGSTPFIPFMQHRLRGHLAQQQVEGIQPTATLIAATPPIETPTAETPVVYRFDQALALVRFSALLLSLLLSLLLVVAGTYNPFIYFRF